LALGCLPTPDEPTASQQPAPSKATTGVDAPPAPTESSVRPSIPRGDLADREVWEVVHLQGVKVGHAWTKSSHVQRDGQPVARIESRNHLVVERFGQPSEVEIRLRTDQTPEGKLLDFDSTMAMGSAPMVVHGRVDGDKLLMETVSQGATRTSSIPWSADLSGFYAVEHSLASQPMRPGERRVIRMLAPTFHEIATVELTAKAFEPVKLLAGSHELLRIDNQLRFAGKPAIEGTMWVDRTGEVLKTQMAAMSQETYRVTKAEALDQTDLGRFDLGKESAVPVDRPLAHPHAARWIRYRVELKDGDPAGVLVVSASQKVASTGPNSAEVTVYALRPGVHPEGAPTVSDPPSSDDLRPNSVIQSDDPVIVAMAKELVGDKTEPWSKALALERGVHELVRKKNFSQAFATAAEVARSREGDCTEHAVLLAALARAVGLPSRVAIGLVYTGSPPAFGYHMWTQVCLDDRWIPLDATLAEGGIGAGHLELAHANLADAAGYSSFLPVIQVIGRMKIAVVEEGTEIGDQGSGRK